MARQDLIALCSSAFLFAGGFGFGWFITPELLRSSGPEYGLAWTCRFRFAPCHPR